MMESDLDASAGRAAPRMKIFMPTELDTGTGTVRIHLLDLSSTGALAYAQTPPRVGALVRLACGVTLRQARVAWVSGPRFGLAFDRALTEAQVDGVLLMQEAIISDAARRMNLAAPALPRASAA